MVASKEIDYLWQDLPSGGKCYASQGSDPETLILGGIGDGKNAIEYTVSQLNSIGYNVAGVTIDYPDEKQSTSADLLKSVIPEAIKLLSSSEINAISPKNLTGISKGGGEALLAAYLLKDNNPRLIGDIAVVNAVGPGNVSMGTTPMERLRAFNKRRKIQQKLTEASNDILFMPDIDGRLANFNGLKQALSRDDCAKIVQSLLDKGHRIFTLFGEDDPIFTPDEAEIGLSEIDHSGLTKLRIAGDHASLFRKLGQSQLRLAIDLLNK